MGTGKFDRIGQNAFFLLDTTNYQTMLTPYDDKVANLTILYQWEKPRTSEELKRPPKLKEIPIS